MAEAMGKAAGPNKFRKPPYYKRNVGDMLSSLWVQRMTSEQRGWYNMMLDRNWDADKCLLANDPKLIPLYAGVNPDDPEEMKRFADTGWIVIQRFETTKDGKFIFNRRIVDEYKEFLIFRRECSKAGKKSRQLAKAKKAEQLLAQSTVKVPSSDLQGTCKQTETETEVEAKSKTERKPSAENAEADFRHVQIREHIKRCVEHATGLPKAPWNGRDGKALSKLLADNPSWTAETIIALVKNRFRSDVPRGEPAHKWLPDLAIYANGPLDRFGKVQDGLNKAEKRQNANLAACDEAIRAIHREAGVDS